jgi:hypothetical protein
VYRRKLQLASLMVFFAVHAWAQTVSYSVPAASVRTAPVEDAFSAYHVALSSAADALLSAPDRIPRTLASGVAANAHQADGGVLSQFAQRNWGGQEENVRRAVARVALLRPILDPILHDSGVPVDVAALVLVESGGRSTALSSKGALGLWQFMPATARRYGLVVTPALDERIDVVKSTRAAAHYLRDLYLQFGDWKLAFAAYNAGEGTVQRAMGHGTRDFETLSRRLPQETRNYVPAVLSAVHLLGGALPKQARLSEGSANAKIIYAESDLKN